MVPPCGRELASKIFTKNLTCTVDTFSFPISFMLRLSAEINQRHSDATVVILLVCEVRGKGKLLHWDAVQAHWNWTIVMLLLYRVLFNNSKYLLWKGPLDQWTDQVNSPTWPVLILFDGQELTLKNQPSPVQWQEIFPSIRFIEMIETVTATLCHSSAKKDRF